MIKYSLVLFDFDGTLMDTSSGIFDTMKYVMKTLNQKIDNNCDINKFIGPPLNICFSEVMGLEEGLVDQAMDIYRKRYEEKGQFMAEFYDGIIPLLKWLKTSGTKTGIATLKNKVLAESMANYFDMMGYMDGVFGMKYNSEKESKAQIIRYALDYFKIDPKDAVLIGDTLLDFYGAREVGLDFIGAGFGFGFNNDVDAKHSDIIMAKDCGHIRRLIVD